MEKTKGFIQQKKSIRVLGMALAVCAIIFALAVTQLKVDLGEELPKLQLQLIMISYVLQLGLSGLICGMCVYNILSKNDHDLFLLIVGGVTLLSTIFLIINYDFFTVVKSIIDRDIYGMGKMMGFTKSDFQLMELAIYGNIGVGIYSTIIFFAAKSTLPATTVATANIAAIDTTATSVTSEAIDSTATTVATEGTVATTEPTETIAVTATPVANDTVSTEAIVATLKGGLNKAKALVIKLLAFLKTKKGLITMAAIVAAIILLFVGKFIYGKMTMKEVDFTGKIELEYRGYNGEGSIVDQFSLNKSIEYDKTDKDLKNFVKTVQFDISPDNDLSNGDKVKITAEFDEELAEELGIKPINTEREFEVAGLTVLYASVKEIPANVVAEADKAAKKEVEDVKTTYFLDKRILKEAKFVSATPIAKYFTMFSKHPSPSGDSIKYVYKVKIEGLVDGKKETADIYRFVEVNNVKSDLDGNDAYINSGDIYNSDFKEVRTDEEAKSMYKKKLDDRDSYVEAFK
ncbi:MAG: hypothetical protein RR646_00300 [Erysipelotrichaceae bacterium]